MIFSFLYKACRRGALIANSLTSYALSLLIFNGNNVSYRKFKTSGVPYLVVSKGGYLSIGQNFRMHNGIKGNPVGSYDRCTIFVGKSGTLTIGNNVGISQAALICHNKISIGDHVKIGGGVKIYDTDFHSLNTEIRKGPDDIKFKACAPVKIMEGAFIGAYCIVLKGVTIGRNSIVGAGSVVTKSIPDNEIWGGNPAKFIRTI